MSDRAPVAPEWRVARTTAVHAETARARRIDLGIDGWPGSLAGQHVDVRLTSDDGYQATRSYSLASVGADERIELLVDRVEDGEVSGYLTEDLAVGDELEVLGPLGRWFVWRPGDDDARPVVMIAGGSGVVPMISIVRARLAAGSSTPMRLLCSVRSPDDVLFGPELAEAAASGVEVETAYTRVAPEGVPVGRIDAARVARFVGPASARPLLYVCGATGFVERVLDWTTALGHDEADVRAERFGGA